MEIKETLMNKQFSVLNDDPYFLALKAMEAIARTEKVVENKNSLISDGPRQQCNVNFDAIEEVDNFAKIIFNFDLHGEDGLLRVGVNGALDLKIDETGFFTKGFAEHYAGNIFPLLRKMSEAKIKFFGSTLDTVFDVNN